MEDTIYILVLCGGPHKKKALSIIESFDANNFFNVKKINITFIHRDPNVFKLSSEYDVNKLWLPGGYKYIPIENNLIPDNIQTNTEIRNSQYDIILDENCPKMDWGLSKKVFEDLITHNLKEGGHFITKENFDTNYHTYDVSKLIKREINKRSPNHDGVWQIWQKRDDSHLIRPGGRKSKRRKSKRRKSKRRKSKRRKYKRRKSKI